MRDPMTISAIPDPNQHELRYRARLAWNNWPDTAETRERLAEHEARDPYSAAAWDRVIAAIEKILEAGKRPPP